MLIRKPICFTVSLLSLLSSDSHSSALKKLREEKAQRERNLQQQTNPPAVSNTGKSIPPDTVHNTVDIAVLKKMEIILNEAKDKIRNLEGSNQLKQQAINALEAQIKEKEREIELIKQKAPDKTGGTHGTPSKPAEHSTSESKPHTPADTDPDAPPPPPPPSPSQPLSGDEIIDRYLKGKPLQKSDLENLGHGQKDTGAQRNFQIRAILGVLREKVKSWPHNKQPDFTNNMKASITRLESINDQTLQKGKVELFKNLNDPNKLFNPMKAGGKILGFLSFFEVKATKDEATKKPDNAPKSKSKFDYPTEADMESLLGAELISHLKRLLKANNSYTKRMQSMSGANKYIAAESKLNNEWRKNNNNAIPKPEDHDAYAAYKKYVEEGFRLFSAHELINEAHNNFENAAGGETITKLEGTLHMYESELKAYKEHHPDVQKGLDTHIKEIEQHITEIKNKIGQLKAKITEERKPFENSIKEFHIKHGDKFPPPAPHFIKKP